jgi:CheY-like chemotaxis protein
MTEVTTNSPFRATIPPTILVVDSGRAGLWLTGKMFFSGMHPGEIHVLTDAKDLESYLRTREGRLPNLILLGYDENSADPLGLLRQFKADALFRQVPVILMVAESVSDGIREGYDRFANAVLFRPTTPDGCATLLGELAHYWFRIASLSPRVGKSSLR